jgi:hypothetical protein
LLLADSVRAFELINGSLLHVPPVVAVSQWRRLVIDTLIILIAHPWRRLHRCHGSVDLQIIHGRGEWIVGCTNLVIQRGGDRCQLETTIWVCLHSYHRMVLLALFQHLRLPWIINDGMKFGGSSSNMPLSRLNLNLIWRLIDFGLDLLACNSKKLLLTFLLLNHFRKRIRVYI